MLTVAVLEAQNKKLREENDELRETVRQLREAKTEPAPLPPGLPRLPVQQERLLRYLLGRSRIASREAIYAELYGEDGHVDMKIIDVYICKLRKKLAGTDIKIATDWGRGYYIDRGQTASIEAVASDVASYISEELAA